MERVDAFAEASRAVQLEALTALRQQVADDSNAIDLAVFGGTLGALLGVIGPLTAAQSTELPLGIRIAIGVILGLFVGVVFAGSILPWAIPIILQTKKKEAATIWLQTYEAELSRRRTMRGLSARRWQSTH